MVELLRCDWCIGDDLYRHYHDHEWGVPCRDDTKLFEFLILEGAQAGLSWLTILKRREHYRQAFAEFQVDSVAEFSCADVARLMEDKGIVRNRLKIESAISNARHYQAIQAEYGSFSDYIWGFIDNTPIISQWSSQDKVPATTIVSDRISREMKKRGFRFFGSTICYAFMQAMGLVNDHQKDCFKHKR
jgi:DNA-3-methyladenine glycosylase I|tara:strand:- start:80 stop:643 length:564 start_codon:yes stop_codon:yes gene_type:complete